MKTIRFLATFIFVLILPILLFSSNFRVDNRFCRDVDNGRDTIKKDSVKVVLNKYQHPDSLALYANDFEIIQDVIKDTLKTWLAKDRFETTAEYTARTGFETRKKKEEQISAEAIKLIAPRRINLKTITLDVNSYDADNETFTIKISNTESLIVRVPRAEAPSFEKNWSGNQIINVRYAVYNKRFVITKADVVVNYKTYRFDAAQTTAYGRKISNYVYSNEIQSQIPTPYAEVLRYVKLKMTEYMKQDEFELDDAYQKRTTPEEIRKAEAKFSMELINSFAPKVIKFDNLQLSKYNPAAQAFPIQLTNSEDLLIKVTVDFAKKFKENWKFYEFRDATYALFDNKFVVASAKISLGDSVYVYSASNNPKLANNLITAIHLDSINYNLLDDKTYALFLGEKKAEGAANLSITDIVYSDLDKNGQIDAGEKGKLTITIRNTGSAAGLKLKIEIIEKTKIKGITIEKSKDLGNLPPEAKMEINFDVLADFSIADGTMDWTIKVTEALNNNPPDKSISLKVNKFAAPKVIVESYYFATASGDPIKKGEPNNCKIMVQNIGAGSARDVVVKVAYPKTVIASGASEFTFKNILPGAFVPINFEFVLNKTHEESDLKLDIIIKESSGKAEFGDAKTAKVNLNEMLTPFTSYPMISDIDRNIPKNDSVKNKNTFALIIGNEDYRLEAPVIFAAADAIMFRNYAEQTLAIPSANIKFKVNAEKTQMEKMINDIVEYAKTNKDTAEIIVFYAGHGFPQEVTNEPYIMPVDIKGSEVTNGIKLSLFYEKLTSSTNIRRVTVFIDACFSGGGREQGLLAARAVKVKPKEHTAQIGSLVVFSASSGEQVALPYKDMNHGMFSYYLLKKFQESKGNFNLSELADFIQKNVASTSKRINDKDQSPKVNASQNAIGAWETWRLK